MKSKIDIKKCFYCFSVPFKMSVTFFSLCIPIVNFINYLDVNIKLESVNLVTRLFDKRNNFNFNNKRYYKVL